MKKVFIIHGFGSTPNGGWRPWLMGELEKDKIYTCALPMPDSQHPVCKKWIEEISRNVERNEGDEIFLVGHSLGVPAILNYLTATKHTIAGAVLVSGRYEKDGSPLPGADSFFEIPLDFQKIKLVCNNFCVIHGDNDSLVPFENAQKLSKVLNCELITVKDGGHLNGSAGWIELPQCLEVLQKMIQ